jgi:hypothetical protein
MADSWGNFPMRGVALLAKFLSRFEKSHNSAVFLNWHGSCTAVGIGGMIRRRDQGEFR